METIIRISIFITKFYLPTCLELWEFLITHHMELISPALLPPTLPVSLCLPVGGFHLTLAPFKRHFIVFPFGPGLQLRR